MTVWLFDLGNSRLKYAPLNSDGSIGDIMAIAHDGNGLGAQWNLELPVRFDTAFVASVASNTLRLSLTEALTAQCRRITLATTQRTFEDAHFGKITVAYSQPQTFGVDRFLALLAAQACARCAWLVAGIGTAITLDLLDAQGRHHGGRIAPGPPLMRHALHRRAVQLPESGGAYIEFATSTDDALASGCEGAAIGLIEHSLQAATKELGTMPRLLLHGGGSDAITQRFTNAVAAPGLVLEGLARWAAAESSTAS